MLKVEKQNYLLNLEQFEGLSLREIAEKTGHHFNTVKKYVDREDWNEGYKERKARKSKLDELKPVIDEWIEEDMKRRRKDRRTAKKIYNDLKKDEEHGKKLKVSQETVTNYVRKRKGEIRHNIYETAMFGLHSRGQAQLDFGEILIKQPNGAEVKWSILALSFPWSNAGFAQVCRSETKECLCESLQRIFEYIGGVPLRILFDNMSSAVVKVEENGERKLTEMFMRFTMHHRYKADFCNPESPQEKGNIENKVGYMRRNYFCPPPKVDNLEEFNKNLLKLCTEDLDREHYRKEEKISELWKAEQEALIPLCTEKFRVFSIMEVKTDKYSFIRFDKQSYSTAPEYAECKMWLEYGDTELRILNEKFEFVVGHERVQNPQSDPVIDYGNYIVALSRKPRAFLASPYFSTLPGTVQRFLKILEYGELKKMLKILTPIIQNGKINDAAAVLELTEIRDSEEFNTAFRALSEDMPQPAVITPTTPVQTEYKPNFGEYSALWGGND